MTQSEHSFRIGKICNKLTGKMSSKDDIFNYKEFVDVLFEVFKLDPEWTEATLNWWNE